jgi:hypothetical protein
VLEAEDLQAVFTGRMIETGYHARTPNIESVEKKRMNTNEGFFESEKTVYIVYCWCSGEAVNCICV